MAFVVSGGELGLTGSAPQGWTPAPWVPLGMSLSAQVQMEYAEIWKRQPQVRTVVGFLARNIAQLNLHLFRRVSDTDRQRLADHPLAQLLAEPVPGAPVTRYRLIERLVADQGIYDIAYWAKVRAAGRLGLLPLPVPRVQPEGGNWLSPKQYRVLTPGAPDTILPAEDVVVFHGYHPEDARTGCSPLESLRSVLLEEFEAARSREQMWRGGARLSGVIKRPKDATKWSDGAFDRFKASWQTFTQGGGAEGGTPILEDGMEYQSIGLTPEQAQYIQARKLTREEVAAAYHIPLPMVGILDNATFSNIKEQHQHLYQDTLGPWLTSIQEDIKLQLLPEFEDSDGLYVEFNLAEKMRGSFEEQAAAASTATGGPWMTRNEQRARFNLPQIEGGDELITPLNVTTGGLASPRDTAPPPEGAASRAARAKALAPGGRKEDRPESLGDVDGEAATFAAALMAWTERESLTARDSESAAEVLARWAEGSEDRQAALAALLAKHGFRLAQAGAWEVFGEHNPEASGWDAQVMLGWILAAAQTHAEQHEDAGRTALEDELKRAEEDPDGPGVAGAVAAAGLLWQVASLRRSTTASTEYVSFGGQDAAVSSGLKWKVWHTAGRNPRPTHKALNGEKVSVDDVFGNGLRWPGDGKGKAQEVANCRCRLKFDTEPP